MPTLYKEENQEYYFLIGSSWVHESLIDTIYSMKEENIYGYA
jgi:hypothetical protein